MKAILFIISLFVANAWAVWSFSPSEEPVYEDATMRCWYTEDACYCEPIVIVNS